MKKLSSRVTLDSPVNNSWNNSRSINFTFTPDTATDFGGCYLWTDESGWSLKQYNSSVIVDNSTNTINETFGSDGSYLWNIECNDTTGYPSFATSNLTINIDTTLPLIDYNSNTTPTGNHSQDWIFVNVSINETNIDTVTLELKGEVSSNYTDWSNSSTNYWRNTTGLPNGEYTIKVYVNDSAGNVNVTSTRTITLDVTSPIVTYKLPTPEDNSNTSSNITTFNATVTDALTPISACFLEIDSKNYTMGVVGAGTQVQCNLTNSSMAEGTYTYTIWANDSAGNWDSETTRTLTIDRTPPVITVDSPLNNTYGAKNIDYQITVDESLNWSRVSINGTANMTMGNSSLQYSNLTGDHPDLPQGTHNATFYVQDLAGNTNQTTVYFTIDYSMPDINITSPQNTTYGNGSLDYNMTITNNISLTGATVEVNGSNYTMDNSSLYDWYNTAVGELSEGYYNATFYANSTGFDNTKTVYFTVDTSPPYNVTLNYPQNNSNISSQNITFRWTSYDNISTQLWSNLTINGSVNESGIDTFNGTSTTFNVSELADGTYNWSVVTWDPADNSNNSVTYYFTVDTIPPTVSFITPGPDANISGSVYVNVTVSDATDANTGVYNVSIDTGGGWVEMNLSGGDISDGNWTYSWNTTSSSDGPITLTINATDFAGGSTIITRNVTVDNTPPTITITLPGNTTYYYNESLPLNFILSETGDWCAYFKDGEANVTIACNQNTSVIG